MSIGLSAFSTLILVALGVTCLAPLLLLVLLLRDWKRKQLW